MNRPNLGLQRVPKKYHVQDEYENTSLKGKQHSTNLAVVCCPSIDGR